MIMSDAIVTFSQQSESWLESLKTRKRKPVSPATLRVFGSYMRRLTPMIGEKNLADISNGVLRDLVQRLDAQKLSAKMISELIAVVKQVVASAVDNDGNQLFPRAWSCKAYRRTDDHQAAPAFHHHQAPRAGYQERTDGSGACPVLPTCGNRPSDLRMPGHSREWHGQADQPASNSSDNISSGFDLQRQGITGGNNTRVLRRCRSL